MNEETPDRELIGQTSVRLNRNFVRECSRGVRDSLRHAVCRPSFTDDMATKMPGNSGVRLIAGLTLNLGEVFHDHPVR